MKHATSSILILAGLFILGTPLFAETVAGQAVSAPAAKVAAPAKHHHEKEIKFPKIHKALHEVKEAKKAVDKIPHELNGHKTKASQLLEQAAEELKAAMTEAQEAHKAKKEAKKAAKTQQAAAPTTASVPATQN